MVKTEVERFEDFLSNSFQEVLCRELRLSNEELEYLKKRFPKANIERMRTDESPDDKHWYLVKL